MKRRLRTVGVPRTEKHLVQALVLSLRRREKPRSGVVVSSEIDCFQGIADVVCGLSSGSDLLPLSSNGHVARGSFSTAKVLAALSGKKSSTREEIAREAGLTEKTVAKELRLLRYSRIVAGVRGGRVLVPRKIRHPFRTLTAFEVKVKDWTSGIYQARNYRSFAHQVFVALPLRKAMLVRKNKELFKRLRVGLVGIGEGGELVWLIRSPRQRPVSAGRSFLAALRMGRVRPLAGVRSSRHA